MLLPALDNPLFQLVVENWRYLELANLEKIDSFAN